MCKCILFSWHICRVQCLSFITYSTLFDFRWSFGVLLWELVTLGKLKSRLVSQYEKVTSYEAKVTGLLKCYDILCVCLCVFIVQKIKLHILCYIKKRM